MSGRNLSAISMRELAAQCRAEARRPGVDNRTAMILLVTANRLESSADRHVYQAAALERLEAKRA